MADEAAVDALPVKYSTKPLRLMLSQSNCEAGTPWGRTDCAIALALEDLGYEMAIVRKTVAKVWKAGAKHTTHYDLPSSLREVVAANDAGGVPEPGEYELKPSAARIAAKPTGKIGGKQKGAGKTPFRHISTRHR